MIVVDVETTGTDPRKNSIASIGAVDWNNPQNEFYTECRIWEMAEVSPQALSINGFSVDQLLSNDKPHINEACALFVEWATGVQDRTLAGENPCFDRDFLRASFERANLKWSFGYRIVDLHSVVYAHHLLRGIGVPLENAMSSMNLDHSLKYVGLPQEPRPHNALTGAQMEAEAFSRVLRGRHLLSEFADYPIPDYLRIDV